MRYVSKFVLCFMRLMGVRKVSYSKSDLQGHWQWCHSIGHIWFPIRLPLQPCLYLAPFPRYNCCCCCCYSSTASSCTVARRYYHFSPKFRAYVTLHWTYPFKGQSIIRALVHLCINQHTKFEVPSFTNSKDMIGAKIKKKTGHVTLTTLIMR